MPIVDLRFTQNSSFGLTTALSDHLTARGSRRARSSTRRTLDVELLFLVIFETYRGIRKQLERPVGSFRASSVATAPTDSAAPPCRRASAIGARAGSAEGMPASNSTPAHSTAARGDGLPRVSHAAKHVLVTLVRHGDRERLPEKVFVARQLSPMRQSDAEIVGWTLRARLAGGPEEPSMDVPLIFS